MNAIEVPGHLRVLRDEAKRLRGQLRDALHAGQPTARKRHLTSFTTIANRTVKHAVNTLTTVEYLFSGPIAWQGGRSNARIARMYRITRQLERALNALIGTWDAARAMEVQTKDSYRKHLLVDGLHNLLAQVDDLLLRLIDMISYPQFYLDPVSAGRPQMTLQVEFQMPYALEQLSAQWQTDTVTLAPASSHDNDFWCGIGAFAIGVLLGKAFFGSADN